MNAQSDDDTDKSFEPTQKKLEDARRKGDIPRFVDLQATAAYAGLTLSLLVFGFSTTIGLGSAMMVLIDQADALSEQLVHEAGSAVMGGILGSMILNIAPIFAAPALCVLVVILSHRAFVVTPDKLKPKLSRIGIISNAKQKFGRSGLFEFFKRFVKLTIYSICLAFFVQARLTEIVSAASGNPAVVLQLIGELCIAFLVVILIVSAVIGAIDAFWQHQEHLRKNRMSRKEIMDENKEIEGDPYLKKERQQRAQSIATSQMISEVQTADVVIVNPTHYAVALKWSRAKGSAPECVAKGVDHVALRIRKEATDYNVPIYDDPPTARTLFRSVEVGFEISPEHYHAVAAAIRFAASMRSKAKARFY